ncbi:MAG TPA: hypothetical protein PLD23_04195 [Armatimonadota bacterium]|nr:hypothetical protein [Armatimonadota bacterium]HQK92677.1 hypothetical protein [Armatimonadota bacterium]
MDDSGQVTSLTVREDRFHEIAEVVLRAMKDVTLGVHTVVADSVVNAVKEAYLTGYHDGYVEGLRKGARGLPPDA